MGGQAFQDPRFGGFHRLPEELVIVGIDIPKENPDGTTHHRYDERIALPLNEAFVKNIMALGVKEPIVVEKLGDDAYVVAGVQRTRHAREANKRLIAQGEEPIRVPIIVQKGDEDLLLSIAISTNEFRTDDTVLVRAAKAQRLRDRGKTDSEIALIFGVSSQTIANWAKIDSLSPTVKKAIAAGKVTASAAVQLADLPSTEQKTQLAALIETAQETGKAPTAVKAKEAKEKAQGKPSSAVPSKKVLKYIVEKKEEHTLSPEFVAGVGFALGLVGVDTIAGLADVLKAAIAAPAKKKTKGTTPETSSSDPA